MKLLVRSAVPAGYHVCGMDNPASGQRSGRAYFLPKGGGREVDRLDIQHYAFALAVGGHYLAPIPKPRRVLDVGCGTGQWCLDVCAELPDTEVVGLDLREIRRNNRLNYRFVKGDVQHLPFGDATFGFVHQRLLIAAIPLTDWSQVVSELVRVTEPGGWVELAETPFMMEGEGDALKRLMTYWRRRVQKLGLDTAGRVVENLDKYLRDAGLVNVHTRTVLLPVGDWADEVGRMMKQDFRSLNTQLVSLLTTTYHFSTADAWVIIQEAMDELETQRPHLRLRIAYGQRRLLSI